jgi:hypothetical protein
MIDSRDIDVNTTPQDEPSSSKLEPIESLNFNQVGPSLLNLYIYGVIVMIYQKPKNELCISFITPSLKE